jgi:hypothetical protein
MDMKIACACLLVAGMGVAAVADAAKAPLRFPAAVKVWIDEHGIPQQAEASEKLPAAVADAIEQRVLQWRFEPARINGVAKAGITHAFVDACVAPQEDGSLNMAVNYAYNGPGFAEGWGRVPPPRYPRDAAEIGAEGVFRVIVGIAEDGSTSVHRIERVKGNLRYFEPMLRAWVAALRYVPEQVGGKPVPTQVAFPVTFSMDDGMAPSQQKREDRQSEVCTAAKSGEATDPNRPVVLDSPFKPLTTG